MLTHTIAEPPVTAQSFASIEERCLADMANNGIPFQGPIDADGRLRRFSINHHRRKPDEWYIAWRGRTVKGYDYLNCVYGSWSDTTTLDGKYNFSSWEKDDRLDEEERKRLRKTLAKRKKEAEAALKKEQDETAKHAQTIWGNAQESPPDNTYSRYCLIKKIPHLGLRFGNKEVTRPNQEPLLFPSLIVPLCNMAGELRSLQFISVANGDQIYKSFLAGGEKKGCFAVIGELENGKPIGVTEGYGTGASCFTSLEKSEAMRNGGAIVIAFDCGNLGPVTKAIREKYPKSPIVIFGDDDVENPSNPGRERATIVARKYHAEVVFPKFPKGKDRGKDGKLYTDFNDLASSTGIEEVTRQIEFAFTPILLVEPGKIHESVNAAGELIIRKGMALYQRGGQLVRMVKIGNGKSNLIKKRDPENISIIEVDSCFLTEQLTMEGCWVNYDKRSKRNKRIDCPVRVSQTFLARREWDIPCLAGVIQAPTLRHDGSILETPGYDKDTGLFFHASGYTFPEMLSNPSKDDAMKALAVFKELLKGFPFEPSEERSDNKSESFSVALSGNLTALIRRSISTAPLHGFTAPKMGTGKSLLAEVISMIATGKEMTAISQSENEAEEKKRLLAVLMEGDPIVCYDNIEEPFGSASLCSVLTQQEYKDRILGASKSVSVPTNATFLATGNNLTFVGDISTRVMLCRLNAEVERPEERQFDVNLRHYIPSHRGMLVQAGLTMLKAYDCAGRPKQDIRPFGRFEEWSDWVRSTIVWLGEADPCDSRREIEEADPVRVSLIRLLKAWHDVFDTLTQPLKNVLKRANDGEHDELKDALLEIASDARGEICSRRLGKKLSSFNKRIEGGYKLERVGNLSGVATWKVKKV